MPVSCPLEIELELGLAMEVRIKEMGRMVVIQLLLL
jgi:hypothetical protein